jgi:alkylmercury lyase
VKDRTDCCDVGGDLLHDHLDPAALELAANGFAALWQGKEPTLEVLLPGRAELANEVLIELAGRGRAEVDSDGVLVGVHGLTGRATRHRFTHAGRHHHTWCAFDSVGIPGALSLDATATSDCPTCGRVLTVRLHRGQTTDADIVLWLPAPAETTHLMNDFCATADLYCSADHLRQRIDVDASNGRILSLDEAIDLGRETWSDVAHVATVDDRPAPGDDG